MKLAHFFIDRPVFAAVISIVTIIAGALSILTLPVSQYPEIAPPTVNISASYAGANAKTVSETVATPLEQQINGVEHMLYMTSQATNDGNLNLTVTFEVGTNLDIAQVQVQNRIAVALPQLPQEVQQRGVTVKKATPDITLVVAVYSPDGSRTPLYMSNYATLQLKDQLSRLPGVGDLTVFGARDYSMRLWLDPEKAAARNLTAGDILNAVREQNIQVAAGVIGGQPLPAGLAQFQYTVSAQGRLVTPEQFEDIVVKVGGDGRATYLRDVARVELGAADYATTNTFNGKPAVGMAVFQLPGTNAIETANAVYARMKELKQQFPSGLDYAIPYDTTLFVRESIRDVVHTLFFGVLLVVAVVLIFLQNWRAAIVPLLAIPVSLVGTFAVLWCAKFSMNNLSLFGLVLAIGIVVDDAIVVVENVERWIARGLSPRDAAFKAMDEVTPAVIAIAVGLSAVFVPVAFISGITGQFYRQFALTIAFSTLISAFNSLSLSPALAALLIKPHDAPKDWVTRKVDRWFGWFFDGFNRVFSRTNERYSSLLRIVVRRSGIVLVVYLVLIGLAYVGFRSVPTGFIPQQDQGYVVVNIQMPDASSLNRTQEFIGKLVERALKIPGINAAFGVPGLSIISRSNSSAAGVMFLPFKPFSEREGNPELSLQSIMKKLNIEFSKVQEGTVQVFPPPPVRGLSNAGGFKMQLQDRSGRGSPQELQAAAEKFLAAARQRPEVTGLFSSYRASLPQMYAEVDREKAKKQNVPITDIFQTLQVYLGGYYINDFNFLGRVWRVIAQADAPFRATAKDVAQFKTRSLTGGMVPLGAVMDLKDIVGPDRIQRYNLYMAADINGSASPGFSSGQALAAMEQTAAQTLPQDYGFEWTEFAYQEKSIGSTAFLIFPLCVLFVWLTHSAEYESFALSSAIILIVPMCLLCGIAGIWVRGMDNNIFTQIGFVVLAGMSVKNAVLIVEFAKQQQEHNPKMRAGAAALEAAHLRLRPILMTSFAFIFGVFPLVNAEGAGYEMRQALGTAVFYGMLGVTMFGIFLTPVFYILISRLAGRDRQPGEEQK